MRIFNREKTKELKIEDVDLEVYKLEEDKLTIDHARVLPVKEVSHYEVIAEYPNGGKDVQKVIDVEAVEGKEAYTEVEDILVVVPLSYTEIAERKAEKLRVSREPLLKAFDILKGNYAFGITTLTDERKSIIKDWYKRLLNVTATLDDTAIRVLPIEIKELVK